jgi:hypothetical protein
MEAGNADLLSDLAYRPVVRLEAKLRKLKTRKTASQRRITPWYRTAVSCSDAPAGARHAAPGGFVKACG